MQRRTLLKLFAAAALPAPPTTPPMGWTPHAQSLQKWIEEHRYPFFSQQDTLIKGSGEGKAALLYKSLARLCPHWQPHDQQLGDCVGHAFGLGVDVLTATRITIQHQPERWVTETATEIIYGGSRVEIGGGTNGEGSTGHWAAEWLMQYGALLRQAYPGYDFSEYDPSKARLFGQEGVPDSLEPLAKLHPVKTVSICKSYSQLRDSIVNGFPVVVCSNVGFGNRNWRRDSEGFLRRRRSPWYHAMCFTGYDDKYKRPGALVQNSWGNWIDGPRRHEQPDGSFWVDADTVDRMLSQGDSFSLSAYVGYPKTVIPYVIW